MLHFIRTKFGAVSAHRRSEICSACRGSGERDKWIPVVEVETVPCRHCFGTGKRKKGDRAVGCRKCRPLYSGEYRTQHLVRYDHEKVFCRSCGGTGRVGKGVSIPFPPMIEARLAAAARAQ